ncbi:MAG: polysaccharide biosynthesis/export family protein [Parachlamydiales bacterium]|nr:polysaccharide biosynthesis/export family protein [Parachlamydiales bacterium]
MFRILSIISLVLIATSCCSVPCTYDLQGADEFVIDSYKIRQGKFSILEMEGVEVDPLQEDAMLEYTDRIAEDDVMKITVFHPSRDDLSKVVDDVSKNVGYRVIHGEVFLPDLPPIEIAGLTLGQARKTLNDAYNKELSGVEVFVDYKERLARVVELIGNVKSPYVIVDGRIRLYEVLCKAVVNTEANFFMSYVVRNGKALSIDLYKLMHEGDMTQNIVMQANDKIFIADPYDATAMVMGEVGKPSVLPLRKGSLPLREALVAAGGVPFTGDKGCIQVIRGNIVKPKIYVLNWNHIIHLPNHSLLLMPGDLVYVSEKPITKWNRFIDQLLPSFCGVATVQSTRIAVGI